MGFWQTAHIDILKLIFFVLGDIENMKVFYSKKKNF